MLTTKILLILALHLCGEISAHNIHRGNNNNNNGEQYVKVECVYDDEGRIFQGYNEGWSINFLHSLERLHFTIQITLKASVYMKGLKIDF